MWCCSQIRVKASLARCCAGLAALFLGTSVLAQSNTIPIFQFAVFYNSLLEFTWSPPMTINGRVHANGDIYTGSAWQLTFNDNVSTIGTVSSPAWDGKSTGQYSSPTIYNRPCITNASPLTLPGISNTPDTLREIINIPPAGEDPNSPLGLQRYYNKAKIVLLVSNTTITAVFKTSATDPAPAVVTATFYPTNNNPSNYISITTNFPFLSITNYWPVNPRPIVDVRENAILKLTDIDTAILKRWLVTNATLNTKFPNTGGVYADSTNAPNIMYVADNRAYLTGQLTAIRLRNSQTIPTNLFVFNGSNTPSGFTVATPNPLYIYGHYNCPNSAFLGSTNASTSYPASLICDALTLLSNNWADHQGTNLFISKNTPTSTTINAAILTGIVYSTGPGASTFSGGLHNQPRLLEDWTTALTLTLNGSFVNLFNSARATNQCQNPGVYYNAPYRQFSFNSGFLSPWKLPPGTPVVGPAAPFITSHPQDQTVVAGESASFSISNNGATPLGYQWFFNQSNAISGATNSSLSLTNLQPADAGSYSVVVTNIYGSATSALANLTVNFAPIINPPLTSLTLLAGQDAIFHATATGTDPLSYQWQFNGASLDGATDATLALTNVSPDLTGEYSVIVSNSLGEATNSATLSVYASAAATLSALPLPNGSQFQFTVSGVPGFNYVVEVSSNFIHWEPLITNTAPFAVTDNESTNFPARFYRSRYTP